MHHLPDTTRKIHVIVKRKPKLVDVVGHSERSHLNFIGKTIGFCASLPAVVGANSAHYITKKRLFFILFQLQVDGFVATAIVDTGKHALVRFPVVHLHFIHCIGRHIFGGYCGVIPKKLLAVNIQFFHVLAHRLDISGPVHFNARKFF